MDSYLTYTKFYTEQEAESFAELLDEIHVPYVIKRDTNQLPSVFIGESPDPMVLLKIAPEDFTRVNEMMARQAETAFQRPDFSHYFQNFTRDELQEVLQHPGEWNAYDYKIASVMLNQANLEKESSAYSASYEPIALSAISIVIGYLLSLLPFMGILAGLAITQARKTLSNGTKVPIYNSSSIHHGRNMIVIGTIMTIIHLILRFKVFVEIAHQFSI